MKPSPCGAAVIGAAGYAAALGIPVVAIAYSYAQALNYELVAHT